METKTRIFTADANLDFCRMLERVAAAEKDMEIVGTAADGAEALTKIAELRPDVVLLELVLPTLDGLEVLRRMPETGCKPSIIVLSGFINNNVVAACSAAGADGTWRVYGPEGEFLMLGELTGGRLKTIKSFCEV